MQSYPSFVTQTKCIEATNSKQFTLKERERESEWVWMSPQQGEQDSVTIAGVRLYEVLMLCVCDHNCPKPCSEWVNTVCVCATMCVCAMCVQCVCNVCVYRRLEWRHLTAVINDNNTITVKNVLNDANELLGMNSVPHCTPYFNVCYHRIQRQGCTSITRLGSPCCDHYLQWIYIQVHTYCIAGYNYSWVYFVV